MEKKVFSFLLFVIVLAFSMAFVSAVPPIQQTELIQNGINLESPIIAVHIQNSDFKFHIHAYNVTDGKRLNNETMQCVIHLYSPTDGSHLLNGNMSFDDNGVDFEYEVLGGNFTTLGQYSVLFDCQDTNIGGFFLYGFDVTSTGQLLTSVSAIIVIALISLAFIFLALSFFFKDDYWILKSFFQFMAVLAGLIAVNSARIIASESDTLGVMGTSGLLLLVVCVGLFFLWIFVKAFKEIIKIFKDKGDLRWNYD